MGTYLQYRMYAKSLTASDLGMKTPFPHQCGRPVWSVPSHGSLITLEAPQSIFIIAVPLRPSLESRRRQKWSRYWAGIYYFPLVA